MQLLKEEPLPQPWASAAGNNCSKNCGEISTKSMLGADIFAEPKDMAEAYAVCQPERMIWLMGGIDDPNNTTQTGDDGLMGAQPLSDLDEVSQIGVRQRKKRSRRKAGSTKPGPPRPETTVPKIIFTWLKKLLVRPNFPVNMAAYFEICPYKQNQRNLLDFQLLVWYSQQIAGKGQFLFKEILEKAKVMLLTKARRTYENRKRLAVFESYIDRIYLAYSIGGDSLARMDILYQDSPKKPAAIKRLCALQEELLCFMKLKRETPV